MYPKTPMPQASARHSATTKMNGHRGRRIQVRRSGVHGKGVFALAPIARGERVIEYVGEIITWPEAQRRHPHDPDDPHHTFYFHIDDKRVIDAAVGGNAARWINHACDPNCEADEQDGRIFIKALRRHPHDPNDPNHTFYFHIDDERVIDAKVGGNAARWINHACQPNCEADEVDGRVFIKALRPLKPGEELFYDYGLIIDERYTPKLKKQFECRCGSSKCRGTMLAPKR
jgi:SET domain-containing protein